MPVVCGHGIRNSGRRSLRSEACNSGGPAASALVTDVVDLRASSEILVRANQVNCELDSAVVVEAAKALSGLMARCAAALEDRRLAVIAAVWGTERLLRRNSCPAVDVGGVRIVAGRSAMAQVLAEAYGQAERSRLSLSSLPYSPDARGLDVDARLAVRGVCLRALHQRPVLGPEATPRWPVEIRSADLVPMDMLVVDDELALLPVDPDRPGLALIAVTDPGWVRLASVVAESCWARAEGDGGGR